MTSSTPGGSAEDGMQCWAWRGERGGGGRKIHTQARTPTHLVKTFEKIQKKCVSVSLRLFFLKTPQNVFRRFVHGVKNPRFSKNTKIQGGGGRPEVGLACFAKTLTLELDINF